MIGSLKTIGEKKEHIWDLLFWWGEVKAGLMLQMRKEVDKIPKGVPESFSQGSIIQT